MLAAHVSIRALLLQMLRVVRADGVLAVPAALNMGCPFVHASVAAATTWARLVAESCDVWLAVLPAGSSKRKSEVLAGHTSTLLAAKLGVNSCTKP